MRARAGAVALWARTRSSLRKGRLAYWRLWAVWMVDTAEMLPEKARTGHGSVVEGESGAAPEDDMPNSDSRSMLPDVGSGGPCVSAFMLCGRHSA